MGYTEFTGVFVSTGTAYFQEVVISTNIRKLGKLDTYIPGFLGYGGRAGVELGQYFVVVSERESCVIIMPYVYRIYRDGIFSARGHTIGST